MRRRNGQITVGLLACAIAASFGGCGTQGGSGPAHRSGSADAREAPVVEAGWIDDNERYYRYLRYREAFDRLPGPRVDVRGRVILELLDREKMPVPDVAVVIRNGSTQIRRTGADGRVLLLPHTFADPAGSFAVEARLGDDVVRRKVGPQDGPVVSLAFDRSRREIVRPTVDVAMVIDTTGSMGDELSTLRRVMGAVSYRIAAADPAPKVRFAVVAYRDRQDDYVTRVIDFTGDVDRIAEALNDLRAGGGGDNPEDVAAAIDGAVHRLDWQADVKIAFLLGDAPPQIGYDGPSYVDGAQAAAERGIRITAIGASGLGDLGEFAWRQIAQLTQGRFVFLTYGEAEDTSPSNPTGVSHHTEDAWRSGRLDAILVHTVTAELAALSGRAAPPWHDEYFRARSVAGREPREVLNVLFADAARQLEHFLQVGVEPDAPTAVLAPKADRVSQASARLVQDQLTHALAKRSAFALVERAQLDRLRVEEDLVRAAAGNDVAAQRLGNQVTARLVVVSSLTRQAGDVAMFIRAVDVRTGKVVSATKLLIDPALLPG